MKQSLFIILYSGMSGSLYGSSSLLVNTLILLSSYSISITPISMKIPVKFSQFLFIPIFLIKTKQEIFTKSDEEPTGLAP
jgi:hypothetical protein